jgi:hypothetical protein
MQKERIPAFEAGFFGGGYVVPGRYARRTYHAGLPFAEGSLARAGCGYVVGVSDGVVGFFARKSGEAKQEAEKLVWRGHRGEG